MATLGFIRWDEPLWNKRRPEVLMSPSERQRFTAMHACRDCPDALGIFRGAHGRVLCATCLKRAEVGRVEIDAAEVCAWIVIGAAVAAQIWAVSWLFRV